MPIFSRVNLYLEHLLLLMHLILNLNNRICQEELPYLVRHKILQVQVVQDSINLQCLADSQEQLHQPKVALDSLVKTRITCHKLNRLLVSDNHHFLASNNLPLLHQAVYLVISNNSQTLFKVLVDQVFLWDSNSSNSNNNSNHSLHFSKNKGNSLNNQVHCLVYNNNHNNNNYLSVNSRIVCSSQVLHQQVIKVLLAHYLDKLQFKHHQED